MIDSSFPGTVSGLVNLSTRFLSEFERGKETAEIRKVLKALAAPARVSDCRAFGRGCPNEFRGDR